MKFFCALILTLAVVSTHDMHYKPLRPATRVRLVPRNNEREVLP